MLQSAFSKSHSYLCRRTLTFSSSLRSDGNEAARIPRWYKNIVTLCSHIYVCFMFYQKGICHSEVKTKNVLPQQTLIGFWEYRKRGEMRCGLVGKEISAAL